MIIVLYLKLPRILLCEHWHGFIMIIESIWEEIAINRYKFRIRVVSKLQTVIVAVWCWYNEDEEYDLESIIGYVVRKIYILHEV